METFEVTKSGLQRQPSVGPIPGGNKVPWLLAIVFVVLATGVILMLLHFPSTYKNVTEETRLLLNSKAETLLGNHCEKQFCDSKDCVRMASRILEFMNLQADPCSDFYEFACGGFAKSRSIPYAHQSFTPEVEAHHSILPYIRKVLEDESSLNPSQTLVKLKKLYSSCINIGLRKNFTIQSLEYWLSDIQLPLTGANSEGFIDLNSKGSWRDLVRRLEEFRIHTVIKPTFKSSSSIPIETIELDCVVPTFRLLTYSHPTENESAHLLRVYKGVMHSVLDEMKMNETEKNQFINDVVQMETDIAIAIENTRFSTISDLSEELIQQMKELWRVMLGDAVDEVNIVSTCKYSLKNILTVLNNAPPLRAVRYVAWRMLSQLLRYFGGEFRKLHLHFVSKWSAEDYAFDNPWEECSDVLRNEMGFAVFKILTGSGYMKMERAQEINDLFLIAKSYFLRAVRRVGWLDNTTRAELESKIRKMEFNPGFSKLIQERETMDTILRDLRFEDDDYFHSVMSIKKFKTRHAFNRLWYGNPENPISEISLDDNPLGFTSKFDYNNNAVCIDYGLLKPPVMFSSKSIPKYLKYGEMSVLLREMSHLIDTTGIFQENDGLNQALLSVQHMYDSYFRCLLNQTLNMQSNIYPEFFKKQMLNDMIADMGSFYFAYRGILMHLKNNKMPDYKLPGIPLTKKQTYFTQVAQGFCNLKTYGSSNQGDEYDIPLKLRVNVAVSNMEDFGNVFNCPSRSFLNPDIKCNLFYPNTT